MSNKIVLTKIKNSNNILHKESKLVLKSQKEKVVIGQMDDEGEIASLNNEAIKLCKKWGFKYDPDFIDENENEEDQEETENVEETDDVEEQTDDVEEQTDDVEETHDVNETVNIEKQDENVVKKELEPLVIPNKIKTSYIRDLTNEFSSQLYNSFDLLHQTYLSEVSDLQNSVLTKNKIIEELTLKHENTENELNILKKKFEGIKSLFS